MDEKGDLVNKIAEGISNSGQPGLATALLELFEFTDIAEEVIKEMQEKYPDKHKEIWNSFRHLLPSATLRGVPRPLLYRKHCEEIISRIVNGGNPNPGTRAEMLAALHQTSLQAPLNNDHAYVYQHLFKIVFPNKYVKLGLEVVDFYESYPGRANEIMSAMQRKLTIQRNL